MLRNRRVFRCSALFGVFVDACEKRGSWADRGTTCWRRGGGRVGSMCVRRSLLRAQRCAARLDMLCMCLRHVLMCWQVTREQQASARTPSCRGSTGPRTATPRRRERRLGRRRCSGPRRCTHPAGRHVSAARSEGASRPRRCGGSVACASKCTEYERERAMGHGERERGRGQGGRV